MIDKLENFIFEHKKIYVYDIGMESVRIMSGLVKEELINTAFLVDDEFYAGEDTNTISICDKRVLRCSSVSAQKDKNGIGIIVSTHTNVTFASLSDKTGIAPEHMMRDTRREEPERFFRYMSPRAFKRIIENKEFEFVDPNRWDDKCEGYLYHALQTDKGRIMIEGYAKAFGAEDGEIREKLQYVYDNTRCVCVSGSEDSVVMWNAYDYGNEAVMIEISKDALKDEKIMICPIEYVEDNISLRDEIHKVMTPSGMIVHEVYTTKRRCFSYEDETRLFYRTEYPNPNDDAKIKIKPSEFISNVMVHPKAKDEFVEEIENICKENGIKFSGRSRKFEYSQ